MTTTAPTITTVPFSKLVAGDDINARASGGKDGIDALAASIRAKGVIQPLIVRPADKDRYEVIAGNRRLAAIARLVKDKVHAKSWPVPVVVRNEDDAEALDTSLAENDCRLPMHAVDRFEAFARLAEKGLSEPEIAARYGLAERQVKQSLALGRLAPPIREAWRKGKIDAKVAQAFCLHADHAVQTAAFERLRKQGSHGLSESSIRRELAPDRPAKNTVPDSLLERYLAAGGTLAEDLFEEQIYVEDGALLKTVRDAYVAEQTSATRTRLAGQGWAWVAIDSDLPHGWKWEWDRIRPEYQGFSDEDAARVDALDDRIVAAEEAGDEAEADRLYEERDAIEEASRLAVFTPQMRARSGCVLSFYADGEVAVAYGIVRPSADGTIDIESAIDGPRNTAGDDDDSTPFDDAEAADGCGQPDEDEDGAGFAVSQALAQTLSEARTVAAAEALRTTPDLAMRLITAALTCAHAVSPANVANKGHHTVRKHDGRRSFVAALAHALALEQGDAESAFAHAVATTLDLTEATWRYKGRETGIAELIAALPSAHYLDAAREQFLPDDYFKRATKATALAALDEMREAGCGAGLAPEDVLAGMKKADLAAAAAESARACGWLPPELRHPEYSLLAPDGSPAGSRPPGADRLTGKMAAAEQSGEAAP